LSEPRFEPVGEVAISESSKVRVSKFLGSDGKTRIDIRLFVSSEKYTGATRKGVSLPVDKVDELVELLKMARPRD
jgi:hypothetical protein